MAERVSDRSRSATRPTGQGVSVVRRIALHSRAGVVRKSRALKTMTGNRKTRSPPRAGKDIAQFAPNFTVYVLPPDAVCLYSEDRKFFLRGELYCALAEAIAAGRSFRQIVRDLEK